MQTGTVPGTGALDNRQAYLARPVPTGLQPGPWPGVVVVHEALGPTDDMHEQCDRFAAAGYRTLMPDLYHGKPMVRYCLGGGFGLPLAGCGGFHAAAVNDGELPQNLDARRRR